MQITALELTDILTSFFWFTYDFCRNLKDKRPYPSPGGLPDPGTEHRSPASQADSLPSESPGKPGQEDKLIPTGIFTNIPVPRVKSKDLS